MHERREREAATQHLRGIKDDTRAADAAENAAFGRMRTKGFIFTIASDSDRRRRSAAKSAGT